jgi:hypothetical protein
MYTGPVLLTHGYFLADDEKERQIMKPYPPLGLLYLSAYLKRSGYAVEIYDSTFGTREELRRKLRSSPAGIVGIYTNLITRRMVLEIVTAAREAGWTVILGGPESANYPAEYLAAGADAIVIGEGETTTEELLRTLQKCGPKRLHDVAGIAFLDESGTLVRTRQDTRPGQPASARPPGDRSRQVPRSVEDSPRGKQHQPDHRARLPLPMQMVLACGLRLLTPQAQPRERGRRSELDRGDLQSRPALVCRRRLHDQPSLDGALLAGACQTGAAPAVRDDYARGPVAVGSRGKSSEGAGVLSDLDRLGER